MKRSALFAVTTLALVACDPTDTSLCPEWANWATESTLFDCDIDEARGLEETMSCYCAGMGLAVDTPSCGCGGDLFDEKLAYCHKWGSNLMSWEPEEESVRVFSETHACD